MTCTGLNKVKLTWEAKKYILKNKPMRLIKWLSLTTSRSIPELTGIFFFYWTCETDSAREKNLDKLDSFVPRPNRQQYNNPALLCCIPRLKADLVTFPEIIAALENNQPQ